MRGSRGFSLVELLAAIAIAAVLAGLALPGYRAYVLRTNRVVAKTALLEIADRQESHFSEHKAYADSLSAWYPVDALGRTHLLRDGSAAAATQGAIYRLRLTRGDPYHFLVEAEPVNFQSRDAGCGTLSYDSLGDRGASGTLGAGCWR